MSMESPKTKDRQFDKFVITRDTVSCPNDNQWRQIYQIDNLFFLVNMTVQST